MVNKPLVVKPPVNPTFNVARGPIVNEPVTATPPTIVGIALAVLLITASTPSSGTPAVQLVGSNQSVGSTELNPVHSCTGSPIQTQPSCQLATGKFSKY